jgi:hypothetical protein
MRVATQLCVMSLFALGGCSGGPRGEAGSSSTDVHQRYAAAFNWHGEIGFLVDDMQIATNHRVRVEGTLLDASLSANQQWLACTVLGEKSSRLVVARVDGSERKVVLEVPAPATLVSPSWAPDGTAIAISVTAIGEIPRGRQGPALAEEDDARTCLPAALERVYLDTQNSAAIEALVDLRLDGSYQTILDGVRFDLFLIKPNAFSDPLSDRIAEHPWEEGALDQGFTAQLVRTLRGDDSLRREFARVATTPDVQDDPFLKRYFAEVDRLAAGGWQE